MDRIYKLLAKYREQVMYIVFGGLTTLVNIVVYYVVNSVMGLATVQSPALAQLAAYAGAHQRRKQLVPLTLGICCLLYTSRCV